MPLNRSELCQLIPHTGSMCLLDKVHSWDDTHISCSANTHRSPDNPLRSRNQLHGLCGVEYAAQAMAVHGALSTAENQGPMQGFLASVRDLTLSVARLDDIQGTLQIDAERLMGSESNMLYTFTVKADGIDLLSGRASVFLVAQPVAGNKDIAV